jgi:hypothetical protein
MVDHVAPLGRFILARAPKPVLVSDREVEKLQLRVLGNIQDNISLGLRDCEVKNGTLVINLTPDMAMAAAKELMQLARIAKGRII